MKTLIVGIDVSQAHNDVGALTETGEVVDRPRRFANDRLGFEEFTAWTADVLGASEYERVQIGGEATAGYIGFIPFGSYKHWMRSTGCRLRST